jgi:hypothetical protein
MPGPNDDLDYETALELAKEKQAEDQANIDPFMRPDAEPAVPGDDVEVAENGSLIGDQLFFIEQISVLGEDPDYNDSDDVDGWFSFSVDPKSLVLEATYTPAVDAGAGPDQVRRFQLIEILTPSPEVEHDASLDAPEGTEYEEPEPTFLVSPQEYQEQFGDGSQ